MSVHEALLLRTPRFPLAGDKPLPPEVVNKIKDDMNKYPAAQSMLK